MSDAVIRQFGYTDVLGWSYSRYSTFSSCKRQYYYEKYAKYDVAGDLMQIRKLAQLTTVPLEIGNISHKILRTLLKRLQRTSAEIDLERFFDYELDLVDFERLSNIIIRPELHGLDRRFV